MGYEIQCSRVVTPHFPLSLKRNKVQYFKRPCLFQFQIQSDMFKELVETETTVPPSSQLPKPDHDPGRFFCNFFSQRFFLWNLGSVEKVCMLTGREHSWIVYSLCSFDTWARLQLRRARGAQKQDKGKDYKVVCIPPGPSNKLGTHKASNAF